MCGHIQTITSLSNEMKTAFNVMITRSIGLRLKNPLAFHDLNIFCLKCTIEL